LSGEAVDWVLGFCPFGRLEAGFLGTAEAAVATGFVVAAWSGKVLIVDF
jgi:hypothetical protein